MPNRITCFVATSSKNMELTKTGTSSTQLQQLEFSISVTRLHGTTSTKAMSLACQRDLSSPRGRYVDRKLFVALELVQNPPPPPEWLGLNSLPLKFQRTWEVVPRRCMVLAPATTAVRPLTVTARDSISRTRISRRVQRGTCNCHPSRIFH